MPGASAHRLARTDNPSLKSKEMHIPTTEAELPGISRGLAFSLITQTGGFLPFPIISGQLEKWLLFSVGLRLVHGEARS